MIPILFEESTTEFNSNGIGRLVDCVECEVTEERNGIFELELQYPVQGKMYKELSLGRIIYSTHDETKLPQPYEIYYISAELNGLVTVNAAHVSYKLNKATVVPFTASSCADAFVQLKKNILGGTPFTFWTDKNVTKQYKLEKPQTVRSTLGGQENSFLDAFGTGEYEWDHFNVKFHLNRGANHGVTIRYGKNLISLEHERDKEGTFNAVVPFYMSADGELVTLPEWAVYGEGRTRKLKLITRRGELLANGELTLADFAELGIVPLDLSGEFSEKPTVSQLRSKAQQYLTDNRPWVIKENIKIDFVALWQTEEYKDVAPLQRISLCDWVNVYVPSMDIIATAECISVTYDVLNERYTVMELGEAKRTLNDVIAEVSEKNVIPKVVTKTNMNQAIYSVTQQILGGKGGWIKYIMLDGEPSEMLIMNQRTEESSTNILRFNKNGIGFSTDGGRTYRTAWTIDGKFVADFITTGTLLADLIKVGVLSDASGLNSWDMRTGTLTTRRINITELVNINAGAGSTFRFPLSETDPDNNFFELRNESPQFRMIFQADWGGAYVVTIDPENGFNVTSGDYTSTVAPDSVSVTTPLNGNYTKLTERNVEAKFNGVYMFGYSTLESYVGDIGENTIGSDGTYTVTLNQSFLDAVSGSYQVFVQSYTANNVWINARNSGNFVVGGTPGTKFGWEVKAKKR